MFHRDQMLRGIENCTLYRDINHFVQFVYIDMLFYTRVSSFDIIRGVGIALFYNNKSE